MKCSHSIQFRIIACGDIGADNHKIRMLTPVRCRAGPPGQRKQAHALMHPLCNMCRHMSAWCMQVQRSFMVIRNNLIYKFLATHLGCWASSGGGGAAAAQAS